MSYELTFEFDGQPPMTGVRAERVVSDPRHEVARIDIPLLQPLISHHGMIDLARRIQSETPNAIFMSGDEQGMFMIEQSSDQNANILLRFYDDRAREDAYVEGRIFDL